MSVFLEVPPRDHLFESEYFFLIFDRFPVSPGHILIISKQPRSDFFELKDDEKLSLPIMIETAKNIIEKFYQPHGYNIGMNCGLAAGQTVMHFHCHVIPRYNGDMNDPRGGIRHAVAGKGYY